MELSNNSKMIADIFLAIGVLTASLYQVQSDIFSFIAKEIGRLTNFIINGLNELRQFLTNQLENLLSSFSASDMRINALESQINSLIRTIERLQSQMNIQDNKIKTNTTNINTNKNNINIVDMKVNDLKNLVNNEVKRLTNYINDLINPINLSINALKVAINLLQVDIKTLFNKVDVLENFLNMLNKKLDDLGLYLGGMLKELFNIVIQSINQLRLETDMSINDLTNKVNVNTNNIVKLNDLINGLNIPDMNTIKNLINATVNNLITPISNNITNLQTKVNNLVNNVTNTINKVTNITNVINNIDKRVTNNYTTINQLDNKINTKTMNEQNIINQINTNTNKLINTVNVNQDKLAKDIEKYLGLSGYLALFVASVNAFMTKAPAIAKEGACNALNSGCGQSQFGNTLNKAINPLNTALSGADLIQNSVLLRKIDNTVNTIKNTTDTITKKVKGLYDNLGVDRALKIIDTALLFHNASMLSYNLFQTLGDTIDITLQALNIPFKDEEGNNLEFTQFINSSIKDFVINIVGQETYTNTVVTWNSINRIYQSGANLLYATRSLFDESLDYSEMIGEMLGKFMNTAKKDGLVKEDSYPTQKENLPPKSKYRKNFENFNENLEDAEIALDSIAMVSASTLGIVSEFKEIQETSLEFKNVMNEETTALDNIYNQEKSNSVINVDIDRSDIESTL
jgi:hypothetical protein